MNRTATSSFSQPRMTPLQFAKADCAALQRGRYCMLQEVDIPLSVWLDNSPNDADLVCRLSLNERCEYFERFVLPLADHPGPKADPKLQLRRANARAAYSRQHELQEEAAYAAGRACPDCGAALALRKRYCPTCAAKRRKKTYRAARSRRGI